MAKIVLVRMRMRQHDRANMETSEKYGESGEEEEQEETEEEVEEEEQCAGTTN